MVTLTPASSSATLPDRPTAVRPTAVRPTAGSQAALVTVRFGEYLRDQLLLSEEQWLAALAAHWSEEPRRRFGDAVVSQGFLPAAAVERAAAEFHDGLDVIEVSHDLH